MQANDLRADEEANYPENRKYNAHPDHDQDDSGRDQTEARFPRSCYWTLLTIVFTWLISTLSFVQ